MRIPIFFPIFFVLLIGALAGCTQSTSTTPPGNHNSGISIVSIVANPDTVVVGEISHVVVTLAPGAGAVQYAWSNDGLAYVQGTSDSAQVIPTCSSCLGDNHVSCTVTNSSGASNTVTTTVTVIQ